MKEETQVVIHDVKTGAWELNVLKFKLQKEYTPGLTTIMPIVQIDGRPSGIYGDVKAATLTAPKWHEYVSFGLKMGWELLTLEKVLWFVMIVVFWASMALVFWNGVLYHINLGS